MKDIEQACILWEASEATHPGKVRQENQDSTISRPDQCIWAVADGIGGHSSGELASRAVVERLEKLPLSGDLSARTDSIVAALNATNSELIEQADTRGEGLCGSTVVSLINYLDQIAIVWVGDSRAYRLRRGELVQLTRDHTQAEELIERGLLSRREGQDHPASNILTQAIGADISLNPSTTREHIELGDIFLICSDGVYNEIEDQEIVDALLQADTSIAARKLKEKILDTPARDNFAFVIIKAIQADDTKTVIRPVFTQA